MKYSILATLFVSLTLLFSLLGCNSNDSDTKSNTCSVCIEDHLLKESVPLEDGTGRTCKSVASIQYTSDAACSEHRIAYGETCCEPPDSGGGDTGATGGGDTGATGGGDTGATGGGDTGATGGGDTGATGGGDTGATGGGDTGATGGGDTGATGGGDTGATGGGDTGATGGGDTGGNGEYCGPLDGDTNTTSEQFADEFCCLCKDCIFGPIERSELYIDSNQLTCSTLSLEMANPSNSSTPGSEACHELQIQYRETCCNPDCTPPSVEQEFEPVTPPYSQGDQPVCDLCYPYDLPNGQFPLKPHTITAVLGIPGNPTCENLYWMGRTGNIPDALCYPMQDYMEEPCGCSPPGPPDHTQGNDPWCDICPNGQYPLRPGTHSTEFDMPDNPSCENLYWIGRTGNISESSCQQLQKNTQEPCGCLPAK